MTDIRYRLPLSPLLLLFAVVALAAPPVANARIDEAMVLRLKKSVVNVRKSVAHGLNAEKPGRAYATGFVVDAKRGIIATNRHVSGTSPSQTEITFENGETAEARLLHYDLFHDFAFYRIDLEEIDFPLQQVVLGSSFDLAEQDEVVMVGNNDVAEYSVKFGRVTNLVIDRGDRHSATFQTSFDRAGGSSGSPVVDTDGKVVGIHFKGTSTTSFEMRIEYITDALEQLRANGSVRRGDIGVEMDLIRISDARDHFDLPVDVARRITAMRDDLKRMLYIDELLPAAPAADQLRPGDLVVAVDGEWLGDDLYRFDRLLDQHVGRQVTLTLYRNGERLEQRVAVPDAETTKVRRFALFAGGVLHDVTPRLRRRFGIATDGVFLSQADPGTPMADLGSGSRSNPSTRSVTVDSVNGMATPNLEAFIRVARDLESGEDIHALLRDHRDLPTLKVDWLTLELKYHPLRVFEYDTTTLEWVETDD